MSVLLGIFVPDGPSVIVARKIASIPPEGTGMFTDWMSDCMRWISDGVVRNEDIEAFFPLDDVRFDQSTGSWIIIRVRLGDAEGLRTVLQTMFYDVGIQATIEEIQTLFDCATVVPSEQFEMARKVLANEPPA